MLCERSFPPGWWEEILATGKELFLARLDSIEQGQKLIDCQAGFSDESPEEAASELSMVRNRQTAMRWLRFPQDDVRPPLPVTLESDFLQRSHHLPAGDSWQPAHTVTSTISSSIEGGIGSLWDSRLSR